MSRRLLLTVLLLVALLVVGSNSESAPSRVATLANAHTIRVMTYNIHVGVGMDKKLDLARIAGVINAKHPDLVGLQEVDRGVERTQRIDEIAEIARMTKMDYAFAFKSALSGRAIRRGNSVAVANHGHGSSPVQEYARSRAPRFYPRRSAGEWVHRKFRHDSS
ncbi:MAG: hypothetical protein DMF75_11565 [Acidobacteria bacterium]|nr:MAG: hypothetical protein DMF75_11565 [Acidobacteriota bacterium]